MFDRGYERRPAAQLEFAWQGKAPLRRIQMLERRLRQIEGALIRRADVRIVENKKIRPDTDEFLQRKKSADARGTSRRRAQSRFRQKRGRKTAWSRRIAVALDRERRLEGKPWGGRKARARGIEFRQEPTAPLGMAEKRGEAKDLLTRGGDIRDKFDLNHAHSLRLQHPPRGGAIDRADQDKVGRKPNRRLRLPVEPGETFRLRGHDRDVGIGGIGRQTRDLRGICERQDQLVRADIEGNDSSWQLVRARRPRPGKRDEGECDPRECDEQQASEAARHALSAVVFRWTASGSPARKAPGEVMIKHSQGFWLVAALIALLLGLAVGSLAVGPAGLSPGAVLRALFEGEGTAGIIVRDIRLPRTLLAILIGATLGLAGAALQGLLRNPLAEPALFGAPQAAAAAASLVIAFGLSSAISIAVPLAGISGALVSIGGLVAIAGRRASLTVTLLAGLAFANFAGAATALVLNLAPNPYIALEIAFWLLGSLQDRSLDHVVLVTPFLVASWVLLASQATSFRALTLGEDAAASLGVDLARTRLMVVTGVAIGVGAAVAVAGSIGFVGLVAPHLIRRLVGSDPLRVLAPAALAGAALLLASDIAVRLVPGAVEIKLGVVTALIGVPFFLGMIFAERRLLEGAPS